MDYKEYTAKSVDEAITKACLEFGVTSDRLDYEVVREASNGFLGIGSKSAIIKARKRTVTELEKERKVIDEIAKKDEEFKSNIATVIKEEPKEVKAEAPISAEKAVKAVKAEKPARKEARNIVTSDEIEKRAAAAAKKAKEAGIDTEAPKQKEERERRPRGGRDNRRKESRGRDKGRGGKSFDRSDRSERGQRNRRNEVPVTPHEPSKPKPERVVSPKSEEEVAALIGTAKEFLNSVFSAMDITVDMNIEYDQAEGSLNCSFDGDEMGLLIGKRGQTLDSLQYLTNLVINKEQNEYIRVKLDTEGYRSRRADTLENLAKNIAFKVKRTRRAVSLEPMNPYERRIIHSALQNNKFVETYSEGEEPYRHVVVAPKR